MKPRDFTKASDAHTSTFLIAVWFGLAAAFLGLLLWPNQDVSPRLDLRTLNSLSPADRQALIETETRAVMAAPLESVGLINLAQLAKSDGDTKASDRFYELAAARSARDFFAQSQVIDNLIAHGQISAALTHIDGVLRSKSPYSAKIFEVLAALAQRDDGLRQLVDVLGNEPPWRTNFFNYASANISNPDVVYSIFAEMRKRHIAIADGEVRGFLKNLIDQKNIQKAYFVWLDLLNEKQLQHVKLLYDGDFFDTSQNLFFDWTIRDVPSVSISNVLRPGGQGEKSLLVDFSSAVPNSNLIEQYVLVPPGNYILQGESNVKYFRSENGLQWQIRCAEKTSAVATLPSGRAGLGWDTMETEFSVPAEACDYQKIVLRLAEPSNGSKPLTGQAYFSKLRIVKRP